MRNRWISYCMGFVMVLLMSRAVWAESTGYVVGRAVLEIDGYQGIEQIIPESATIQLAHVTDSGWELMPVRTDAQGYFVLSDAQLSGAYYPYSLQGTVVAAPLPSVVPDPDAAGGLAGMLYVKFSSTRESAVPIIDCGETRFLLLSDGHMAVERRYRDEVVRLDREVSPPLVTKSGSFGFPGLDYFSESTDDALKQTANQALLRTQRRAEAFRCLEKGLQISQEDESARQSSLQQAVLLLEQLLEQGQEADVVSALMQARLAQGNREAVVQLARQQKVARVYFQAYRGLMAAQQFAAAEAMLRNAIACADDGSLSINGTRLERLLQTLPVQQRNITFFINYLKQIQQDHDTANWMPRPYDRYMLQHP